MEKNRFERLMDILYEGFDKRLYVELHWQGTFNEYLQMVYGNPRIIRNAYQRLYDAIISYGWEEFELNRRKIIRYHFFSDPMEGGKDALFGIEEHLARLVDYLKAAAYGYGPERRLILLHGPVGSAKSTIVRLFKKGLEAYSRKREGAIYTFMWQDEEDPEKWNTCPMHEEPLKLLPPEIRNKIVDELNKQNIVPYPLIVEGDLCPHCRRYFNVYMQRYEGDIQRVLKHVRVKRFILCEKDRIGVGTFQPKDEKNQDSTELTGDINYRKIAEYGSDSDPRAFNFDGEFNIANRGIIEFIEVLKLDVAFLYDLLGATQEHVIKPKKFAQTDIDEVIIAHTNEPEYRRLKKNELMEAFRDRTLKIDIPYNLKLDNEIKIYRRDFGQNKVKGKHIAPHTIEIASMWAILTRLKPPKKANITLMQKLKLYNGKTLPGFTEDNVKELMEEADHEGMEGISPRYIQDKLSTSLVKIPFEGCLNPFMLLKELDAGLDHYALITSEEQKRHYKELLAEVRVEFEDIVKNEVQRAICADEDSINRLFQNYIDHVKAYTQKQKVKNRVTGEDEEPDERLMRSVEEKIGISESRKDDFRRELMNYIGAMAVEGKKFSYKDNERLQKALELKLFEDQKDTIRLASLVTGVVDAETQEKIDIVKARLKKSYGYCDICAQDVLTFVASIFARGDTKRT
jgi:serine protein kinase